MMKRACLSAAGSILFLASTLFGRSSLTPDQISQKLLLQPPAAAVKEANASKAKGIDVKYYTVDFDGSGNFNYILAFYSIHEVNDGVYFRLFKKNGADLVLAGNQGDDAGAGGWGIQCRLLDVNGDGIPEIYCTSTTASGRDELFQLYYWNGTEFVDMFAKSDIEQGGFYDLYGDGKLELVTPNAVKGYDVLKPVGGDYKFVKSYLNDPTGSTASDGRLNYVRSTCKRLDPPSFILEEIQKARGDSEGSGDPDATVRLKFGGLQRVHGGAVSLNDVDPSTIIISPTLKPVRVGIPSHGDEAKDGQSKDNDDKDAEKDGMSCTTRSRMIVEVSRRDFLKNLQRLKLDGPLAAGDTVEVKLRAKLRDGTPLSATFTAAIIDHEDSRQEKAH